MPDRLELAPALYRLRIPGGQAHLLNSYLWLEFNTDRHAVTQSVGRFAKTGARIAGFGHGEAILVDAAARIAEAADAFAA